MKVNVKKLAAAAALGGALVALASPAAAEPWRDAHGYWHHSPPPPPRYVHPGYAHPIYARPYARPVYGHPGWRHPGYAHPGFRAVNGYHGAYRPSVYHRGCNSWWHWDRYRHRNVRVTNC